MTRQTTCQTTWMTRAMAAVASIAMLACSGGSGGDDDDDDDDVTPDAAGPAIDSGPTDPRPVVVMSTTLGDLVVQLEGELMPITTANFMMYVDAGFFDGTLIHRVEDDWVIQGGGYENGLLPTIGGPPIALETSVQVSHVHGAISMARTNDPNSATTQWFIVDWPEAGAPPQPAQLDGTYAAFGVLIEGFDVLAAITQVPVHAQGSLMNVPDTEIVVTSAIRR